VTVELVGVCEHPSEGKEWWWPDGTELDESPYEQVAFGIRASVSEEDQARPTTVILNKIDGFPVPKGANGYEFAFRVEPFQGPNWKLGEIWGAWPVAIGGAELYTTMALGNDEKVINGLYPFFAAIDERVESSKMRIGISSGPWKPYSEPFDKSDSKVHIEGGLRIQQE